MKDTLTIERKYNAPKKGEWFHGQEDLLDHFQEKCQEGILFTWDKRKGEACKVFGYYESPTAFYTALMENPAEHRNGYELIHTNIPCHPYMDIEFYSEVPDADHSVLCVVCTDVRARISEVYGIQASIFVSSGSRTVGDQYKNSYHLIVNNVVMRNNHDGEMKNLLTFKDKPNDSVYYYTDENGSRKHVVDASVYSRNRQLRTLLSSKIGSDVPLYRISRDPFHNIFDYPLSESLEDFLQSIVGAPASALTQRLFPFVAQIQKKRPAREVGGGPGHTPRALGDGIGTVPLPFSVELLVDVLRANGDTVTMIRESGCCKSVYRADSYQIRCDQRKQSRQCLHCPTRFHVNNNCALTVTLDKDARWRVDYHCFAHECSQIPDICIGHVRVDPAGTGELEASTVPAALSGPFSREADELYCEQHVRPIPRGPRVIALRSPCGTGKTEAEVVFLKELAHEQLMAEIRRINPQALRKGEDNETTRRNIIRELAWCQWHGMQIVIISHRTALSKKVLETFPKLHMIEWALSKKLKGPIDLRVTPFVIVQYESLSRLVAASFVGSPMGTLVILDEFNSIVHQMYNTQCGNPVETLASFSQLLRESPFILAMDGHLDQDRLDILEKFTNEPAYLIDNTFKSRSDHIVEISYDEAATISWMLDLIAAGERHICPCFVKALAMKIEKAAKDRFGKTKTIYLYTGAHPWEGEDVNTTWVKADLVIYTSTIDCGISFTIRQHFTRCTAFFDNCGGPTFEAAAQMISRARDAKLFRIFCRPAISKNSQSFEKEVIMRDIGCQQLFQLETSFYGTKYGARRTAPTTWDACAPTTTVRVMHEILVRRTRADLLGELTSMLRNDGAVVGREWVESIELSAEKTSLAPEDVIIDDTPPKSDRSYQKMLCSAETHYNFFQFDKMDEKTLRGYSSLQRKNAFHNLNVLAINGTDYIDSMKQQEADLSKFTEGIEALRQTGDYCSNAVEKAVELGQAIGNHYLLRANKLAVQIIELVTGATTPFEIPSQSDRDIAKRLDCFLTTTTKRPDEKEESILYVSQPMRTRFLDLLDRWIAVDPGLHTPRGYFRPRDLSLVKVLHLLNAVLGTMFAMSYDREGHRRQAGLETFHMYTLHETTHFTRKKSEYESGYDTSKPALKPWAKHSLQDLAEEDLIELDGDVIQPGREYSIRQGARFFCRRLPSIHPSDVLQKNDARVVQPPAKRRRL